MVLPVICYVGPFWRRPSVPAVRSKPWNQPEHRSASPWSVSDLPQPASQLRPAEGGGSPWVASYTPHGVDVGRCCHRVEVKQHPMQQSSPAETARGRCGVMRVGPVGPATAWLCGCMTSAHPGVLCGCSTHPVCSSLPAGEHPPQLWHASAQWLPQGHALHAPRQQVWPAHHHTG